jgi:hypothetical protein
LLIFKDGLRIFKDRMLRLTFGLKRKEAIEDER